LLAAFASLHDVMQESDAAPTQQVVNAMNEARNQLKLLIAKWNEVNKQMNFE
jgi:hypothetical protein